MVDFSTTEASNDMAQELIRESEIEVPCCHGLFHTVAGTRELVVEDANTIE